MIKYLKPIVSCFILAVFLSGSQLAAQTRSMGDLKSRIEDYCRNTPWEEIFVHTDRDIYAAGEEMWFSSYLIDRQSGKLSSRSCVAYFELLNPDNMPVIQKRLLITDGICPGNAHLPDTLASGTYTFRIYTNWMKNFLPENAFMKNIIIVNPLRSNGFRGKTIFEKRLPSKSNIEFFPEGGNLLNGLPSKIAVKVSDEYQRGVTFEGVVRNSRGDSVASFTANRFGLGSFEMTPVSGNSYYVLHSGVVTYLPLPLDEGCSLTADYLEKDLVTITITEKGSSYSSDRQEYSLIIQSNGNVAYSETFRIPGLTKTIILSKRGLPDGVNQITLFNEFLRPLCERLVYISHKNESDEPVMRLPGRSQRREKITVNVEQPDASQSPFQKSGFSVSVTHLPYRVKEEQMKDYLDFGTQYGYLPWVDSGKDSQPGVTDFDNFLLGAKGRWITWDRVLSETVKTTDFQMETDVQLISGIARQRGTINPAGEKNLTLSMPGKVALFYNARTDNEGRFNFMMPVDQIQRNLVIQPRTADEGVSVEIIPPYSRKMPLSVSFRDSVSAGISEIFSDMGARYQVNRIFEASVRKDIEPDQRDSRSEKRFYGKPEIELIMDDFIRLPVMQEVFFELTPGVRLRQRRESYEMRILSPFTGNYYDEPATVLIDGVVINDMSVLANLDPEIVEKIDIVKTPYITGMMTHYGIVHVITKPGKFSNLALPDYAVKLPYRVAEPVPLFVSHDYSDTARRQSRIPDFRNTVYWNPLVRPDKSGKISVEFWTPDLAGDYLVEINGITTGGIPVTLKKIFTIF